MTTDVEIDTAEIIRNLIQLGITLVLALPIAINREHKAQGAGLRAFSLVAIASCAFMQVSMSVYSGSDAEAQGIG